ncbi:hypothetical protein GCM10009530_37530 [Microbispora corallina]|uniref:Uncharacterized protein n=1 Tax=Microbispora corallina TaxID=83302 RepID=A0ABQ4G2A3_9ACTN|nr:hypothetical protein [Microbispora corallina]GIH41202.1 hypothetical protein Mco01_42020 [Microbispora corallina]
MRDVDALLDAEDPAWPWILQEVSRSGVPVELGLPDPGLGGFRNALLSGRRVR